MTGNARPPDEPDATDKDPGKETGSDGRPDPSPAITDTALRSERTIAYRAKVDAVYQQYDLDRSHGTASVPERETVSFAMRRAGPEDWHRHQAGIGGGEGTRRDPVLHDNSGREFPETTAGDGALVHDDSPYCPVSELKGDEPPTAERLMKSPEFTGKNLRGFKDTDNPDFIDDYERTYDAVAGPTAWASPRLNMDRMINQIHRHIYDKDGVDFTVLDLTGASGAQIDEIFKSIDKWASNPEMHQKSRVIILGGSY
jgi:hypothetical protein